MARQPFMDVVNRWVGRQKQVLDLTVKHAMEGLYTRLTSGAPVLTGRFVFNFTPTEGAPSTSSSLFYFPDAGAAIQHYRMVLDGMKPKAGQVYWITNNVAYAGWIEYNHPWAKGYVRSAAADWDKIVAKAHARALREVFK